MQQNAASMQFKIQVMHEKFDLIDNMIFIYPDRILAQWFLFLLDEDLIKSWAFAVNLDALVPFLSSNNVLVTFSLC